MPATIYLSSSRALPYTCLHLERCLRIPPGQRIQCVLSPLWIMPEDNVDREDRPTEANQGSQQSAKCPESCFVAVSAVAAHQTTSVRDGCINDN